MACRWDGENEPSNNNHLLFIRSRAFSNGDPSTGFNIILGAENVDSAVLFHNVELDECVQGWSVFDVTGCDFEACFIS